MSVVPVPVALLVAAFRAHAGITQRVASAQIGSQLHGTYPAIRITQLGGPPRPVTNTGSPVLQYEVWGTGPDSDAEYVVARAAQDIEAAVEDGELVGAYSVGKIRGTWNDTLPVTSPDPTTSRVRYLGTVGMMTQP